MNEWVVMVWVTASTMTFLSYKHVHKYVYSTFISAIGPTYVTHDIKLGIKLHVGCLEMLSVMHISLFLTS
jgi:hypothetical protein